MKYLEFCLKNSLLLNMLTILIILSGGFVAWNMNKEAFPSVNLDTVTIKTIYPGASPKEIELDITNPIEDELTGIDGIKESYSYSAESSSVIVLKLNSDLSENEKRKNISQIQKAVDRVKNLPKEILNAPEVNDLDSGELPIVELTIFGDLSYDDLQLTATNLITRIKSLKDAKEPVKYGYAEREYWVTVNSKKLASYQIGLSHIIAVLTAKNINLPGGILQSNEKDYLVRTIGEIQSPEEILNISLRTNASGQNIQIKDIAEVSENFEDLQNKFRTHGKPSINLIIRKKTGGDIVRLVDEVKEIVKTYQAENQELKFETSYVNDMSVFVRNRLGVLVNNGVAGMLLVLLCLLVFLSRGVAFVTALSMPVAMLGAIIVMQFLGLTINLLTLFALVIVLGMLVDDSIIVAENIWQHYENGKSPWQATIDGCKEVFWPVFATILTTIAAFSPLLMVSGIFGKFVESLPKVVMISLLISLIEAMIILPSHVFDILRFNEWKKKRSFNNKVKKTVQASRYMNKLIDSYASLLRFSLKWRYYFLLSLFLLMVSSLFVLKTQMKTILFPNDGIEFFFIRADLPAGSSLDSMEDKIIQIEKYVSTHIPPNELKEFVSYVGLQQMDSLDPLRSKGSHVGQVGVYLSPELQRLRTADQIISAIRGDIENLAQEIGLERVFFTRQRLGPPVGKPVALRVYGIDFDQMSYAANILEEGLQNIPGVSDISNDYIVGKEELQIQINDQHASRSLLSTADIAQQLRISIEGMIATYIHKEGKRIPLRVRLNEEERNSVESIKNSQIMNKLGIFVPLSKLADIKRTSGVNSIKHRNGTRVITIAADLSEQITNSNDVNAAILPTILQLEKELKGIKIERGGEYEDTTESMNSLRLAFLFALAMIFIILASQFKSLSQPLVVMTAIPFGLIGVIAAFYLHGLPLSFLAMIGVIGLSGVVVNDSIVLVDFINKAREKGGENIESIIYAGKRRFRAVCLTSITTIFGLLPLAYGIGGDDIFLKPAAMALAYGLTFSTILILIFVPILYLIRIDIINFAKKIIPNGYLDQKTN